MEDKIEEKKRKKFETPRKQWKNIVKFFKNSSIWINYQWYKIKNILGIYFFVDSTNVKINVVKVENKCLRTLSNPVEKTTITKNQQRK